MKKILIYQNMRIRPRKEVEVYDISTKEQRDAVILKIFSEQYFGKIVHEYESNLEDARKFAAVTEEQLSVMPSSIQQSFNQRKKSFLEDPVWGMKKLKRHVDWYLKAKNENHVASAYELLKARVGWGYGYSLVCHKVL